MVNFDNGVTPINDTNLNKAQTDLQAEIQAVINKLTPTILFQGSTQGNIVLSDNINKYKKIIIYYRDNDNSRYSKMIENVDLASNLQVSLDGNYNSNNYYNTKLRMFSISGTNMNGIGQANFDFVNQAIYYDNTITINLIEGYKDL